MNFLPAYLDTSAVVKLIVAEPESDDLDAALRHWRDRVSASITRVEVERALWRIGASPALRRHAGSVLESLVLIRLDEPILARAASFRTPGLRALDAIHMATALTLGDDPEVFVTYDARLAVVASAEGLNVQHPGVRRLT